MDMTEPSIWYLSEARVHIIEKNQKAYENDLSSILDKKQLRKYRTDQRRAEAERQQAMQRGFGGGGMMPPGGGFPGGGFPGGGFGGPGGF